MLVIAIAFDLPTERLILDETRFPDRDHEHIYEHLLYCYRLIPLDDPLPVIEVQIAPAGLVVTRGHKYLKIARQLGRPTTRAVIRTDVPGYDAEAAVALLQQPDVQQVDWQAILHNTPPIVYQWHVYFFERALHADEQRIFEQQLVEFYPRVFQLLKLEWDQQPIVSSVQYDDELHVARFQAWTPVGIESWYSEQLAAAIRFSREHVRIVSYQGLRFAFT